MILRIQEPLVESIDSLDMEYSMEELHFEVMKEMVIANHRQYMNYDNQAIVTEAVSSIFDKMANYFKELIKKIKEFFAKVMMYINAYLQDLDKFCNQYKDQLNKLNPKFTFMGYKYTIDDNLPVMDEFNKIVSDFNSCLMDVKSLTEEEIKKQHIDFLKTENLNSLRGKVLGKGTPIQEDDFTVEVIKTFKGGRTDSEEIEIDSSYIGTIVSTSKSLVDHKNKCEKDKVALITLLNKTQAFFEKKVDVVYKDLNNKEFRVNTISTNDNKFSLGDTQNINHTDAVSKALNNLVKFKYDQVKNISTMINTVMVERLNSYKANIKQNSQILRQALFNKSEGGN